MLSSGLTAATIIKEFPFPRVNRAVKMARKTGDWEPVIKEISLLTFSIQILLQSVLKQI